MRAFFNPGNTDIFRKGGEVKYDKVGYGEETLPRWAGNCGRPSASAEKPTVSVLERYDDISRGRVTSTFVWTLAYNSSPLNGGPLSLSGGAETCQQRLLPAPFFLPRYSCNLFPVPAWGRQGLLTECQAKEGQVSSGI